MKSELSEYGSNSRIFCGKYIFLMVFVRFYFSRVSYQGRWARVETQRRWETESWDCQDDAEGKGT